MKNMRKVWALLLALAMAFSLSVSVWATDGTITTNGGTSSADVTVKIDPVNINVTVPTTLAVTVDGSGNPVAATTASIVNKSEIAAVTVSHVRIESQGDWQLMAFTNPSFSKNNAHEIGFSINVGGTAVTTDSLSGNAVDATPTDWSISAKAGGTDGSTNVTYAATLPHFTQTLETTNAIKVIFTVSWAA